MIFCGSYAPSVSTSSCTLSPLITSQFRSISRFLKISVSSYSLDPLPENTSATNAGYVIDHRKLTAAATASTCASIINRPFIVFDPYHCCLIQTPF